MVNMVITSIYKIPLLDYFGCDTASIGLEPMLGPRP